MNTTHLGVKIFGLWLGTALCPVFVIAAPIPSTESDSVRRLKEGLVYYIDRMQPILGKVDQGTGCVEEAPSRILATRGAFGCPQASRIPGELFGLKISCD